MSSTLDVTPVGTWLHGVARDVPPQVLATIRGMDGSPVRAVRAAGLVAVASGAPLAEYGEEPLRRNLEDLAWLERAARAHHAVVDALARSGPVVPARLATVHRDEQRLAALLAEHRAAFTALLDRVAGHAEWGVKGYVVPGAVPLVDPPPAGGSGGGAGAAYLRRRKAQLTARDSGAQAAAQAAAAVHEALTGCAGAARLHTPQDRRLSGAPTAMVLNGAYLVAADRLAEFTGLVEALSRRHPAVRLELTGPWPAYSFTSDDQPTAPAAAPAGRPVAEPAR